MYKFFLFATFIATVWIPPLTFANHPFSARRRVNCSGRPPLDPAEDTLCGNTNTTQLECYRQRTRCNSMDRIDHWTSVCLFVVPTKRAEIAADFMENYKHYNCYVKGNFGKANCTSRTKPHLHFVSVCNFTYYYCRADPLACQMDFPMELEGNQPGAYLAGGGHWAMLPPLLILHFSEIRKNDCKGVKYAKLLMVFVVYAFSF